MQSDQEIDPNQCLSLIADQKRHISREQQEENARIQIEKDSKALRD
jgi:hypothetical protein